MISYVNLRDHFRLKAKYVWDQLLICFPDFEVLKLHILKRNPPFIHIPYMLVNTSKVKNKNDLNTHVLAKLE